MTKEQRKHWTEWFIGVPDYVFADPYWLDCVLHRAMDDRHGRVPQGIDQWVSMARAEKGRRDSRRAREEPR